MVNRDEEIATAVVVIVGEVLEYPVVKGDGDIDDPLPDSKVTEGKIDGGRVSVTTIFVVIVFSIAMACDSVLVIVVLLTTLSTMFEDVEGMIVGASVADGNNLVVEDSLAVPVIIKSEDDILILLGFDEKTVRGEAVKVELIVAEDLLSTTEYFVVVTEVGNSVTLGNVVMVASEGSMVVSDSKTVGDDTIIVSEFSLELV